MAYDWNTLDIINTSKNKQVMESHASQQHVLTKLHDGKIYDFNALDFKEGPTNHVKDESWLIDTNAEFAAEQFKKVGDMEKYAALMDTARSDLYIDLLKEGVKQTKKLDDVYMSPARVLLTKHAEAAGDGQILETAQEIVRQTQYQKKVTGVFYRNEKYQAHNIANQVATEGLTIKGAIDLQLPVGHTEIGDDTTPEYTRPEFSTYEKQIFADSFHYGFGMREKSDAWFNIEQQMTKKVPGLMLKLRNNKVLALAKSTTHTTANPTAMIVKWNAYVDAIPTIDASLTIDRMRKLVEDFEGDTMFLMAPHEVIRAYERNVQGRNVTSVNSKFPTEDRTGKLEFNSGVTYFVENGMDDGTALFGVKEAWTDAYTGPQIDIAYKDDKKPSSWEGRLLFHFNGVQRKIKSAAILTSALV